MKKVEKKIDFTKLKTIGDFAAATKREGIPFPVAEDLGVLARPVKIEGKTARNAIVIQPLEGFDGTIRGAPSDLVFRRYRRYATGGAGILWYESIAISDDGRCNPRQMVIKESTIPEIRKLVRETDATAANTVGSSFTPYNIIQLTHSGRRSVDQDWVPTPLAAVENPYIDSHNSIDGRSGPITIASDEKIEEIIEDFIRGAVYAAECGFDSVDVKVCHEYILRELLSAFTRPGKYGGSFENRTRALFAIIDGIRSRAGGLDICVRLNAYDCIPYPYGWGMVKKDGVMEPDLSEPITLCRLLVEKGVHLINLSTMMPRYQPYGRGYLAETEEDAVIEPYKGTYYLLKATREIKKQVPGGVFVSTGLTWLEQFGANVGAGGIEQGWFDLAGFGRQAFAYPGFARDVIEKGAMDRKKCCITCDKCYDLIQIGHTASGCVVRDQEVYLPIYREKVLKGVKA